MGKTEARILQELIKKLEDLVEKYPKKVIEQFGRKGLLERLGNEEKNTGTENYNFFITQLKDMKYDRNVMLGDDFLPDTDYYNAIGAIYPMLSREQKDEALKTFLEKFDKINYYYTNHNHTPFIREPELLSDIGITRGFYWPGLHDEKHLWKDIKNFEEFKNKYIGEGGLFNPEKIKNDFLVAYALLRKDFTSTSFGEDYLKIAHPEFLNRVLKGIVGLRFANASEKELGAKKRRLFELLPESVHDRIESLRQEADWANSEKFLL